MRHLRGAWRIGTVQSSCRVCKVYVESSTVRVHMSGTPLGVRIGELSRRVGVAPETLRAWEQRYGVLRPARTPAGYRVYARADQQRAERMRELIDSGWAASEAAQAVQDVAPEPEPAPGPEVDGVAGELLGPLLAFDTTLGQQAFDRLLGSPVARRRAARGRPAGPARGGRAVGTRGDHRRPGALRHGADHRPPARPRPRVGPRPRPPRRPRLPVRRAPRRRAALLRPRPRPPRLARHLPRPGHAHRGARERGRRARPVARRHRRRAAGPAARRGGRAGRAWPTR